MLGRNNYQQFITDTITETCRELDCKWYWKKDGEKNEVTTYIIYITQNNTTVFSFYLEFNSKWVQGRGIGGHIMERQRCSIPIRQGINLNPLVEWITNRVLATPEQLVIQ